MLIDHIDLRVRDLTAARRFYDPLMAAMGFTRHELGDGPDINYYLPDENHALPFFGLMTDPNHKPNESRIAFRASNRDEVNRLAEVARAAGAREFDPPNGYGERGWYYAAFFEDIDGNKLEICYRE